MITREFKLYLNAGTNIAPVINANQFDQDEEWIFTLLTEDGTVYTPSTSAIIGLKTDGTTILNAGTVNSSGQVVITETEQMTAVPGSNVFELLIDGNTHGTANFVVFVEKRPGDIDNPSESDISLFQEAIEAAGNIEQFQADISALQSGLSNTNANLTAETSARASADATLQSNISTEASTRQTQDAVLQAEIDQIIAPTGEAPSAAEVQNARIGVDGTTYDTLGNAIRGQVGDLKNAISYDVKGFGESLGFYPIPSTGSGYIPCNKAVGETVNIADVRASEERKYWIVPCAESDQFTISMEGGNQTARILTFLDSNDTVLYITTKQTASVTNHVFTAPANTAKVLFQGTGDYIQYKNVYTDINGRINDNKTTIETLSQKINNEITVTSASTVPYSFTVGKTYEITNNSDAAVSFRTRLSPSSSNVEQVTVNAGVTKDFTPTLPADGINLYTNATTISVVVKQKDTLEYRVTNNTERIDALESDGVPSYFRTMMDTKLPQIRANMNETGKNGDSFVFITDIHWENNAKHSLGLIKYIVNNTNINKILCGGDIISQGTVANMLNDMNTVIKGLEFPFHNDLLVAFGNHDSNILSTVADSHFDLNTCYAIMEKEAESYINMMTDYDLSFYYDNKANKTRYIVLDTGEDSGSNNRVFEAYEEFADVLLDTPTGWNIIVMAHIVTYGRFLYVGAMMDAYNSKGTYTRENVGTFDFAEAKGKIICAFGGHTHVDSNSTTTGGIPVIVTGTDSDRVGDSPVYPYVLGTDQEQCFDVVTIDYTAKTIKCVRIGRGVDRTLTYE